MAITQTIATLPAVLNDSETFYEDIAIRNNSLVTVSFPSINTWSIQANALAVEVNDKAAQVAAQAVDGGYSQVYINDNFFSQDYINSNFMGVNNAQDITEVKTFITSPIVPIPTTDYQVANKKYIDDNNKINTLTNKTTPVDADELVVADSTSSFSLKKLSFANLKATLLTYFDTLYSRTSILFGVGQTRSSEVGALAVTYTNYSIKPQEITVLFQSAAAGGTQGQVYINDSFYAAAQGYASSVNSGISYTFIALPSETYRFVNGLNCLPTITIRRIG